MQSKNIFISSVAAILVFSLLQISSASELIMFNAEYCSWCHKWDEEIGVIYSLTPESCQAPIRKVDIDDQIPDSNSINESVQYTPTFVLIHNQSEVGRIVGYQGEDFFWPMLNDLIEQNLPEEVRRYNSKQCQNS
jgi:thioredoxin-related protein